MTDGRRPKRVAETIRKHVAEAFARSVFDPGLQGVMVTRVEMTSDLSIARVHLRSMVSETTEDLHKKVEAAARRATPLLRRGLNAKIGMRKLPDLSFHYDRGQDALDRVERILEEIRADDSEPSGGG